MARFKYLRALAIPVFSILTGAAHLDQARAQDKDAALATYGSVKVTAVDYDASILRIPENDRFGWAMSQDRINKFAEATGDLRLAERARPLAV